MFYYICAIDGKIEHIMNESVEIAKIAFATCAKIFL